jgi:hypothetical protein
MAASLPTGKFKRIVNGNYFEVKMSVTVIVMTALIS